MKKRPDQHQAGFLVRLPDVYKEQLDVLRQETRRPYTEEVKLALEKHLAEKGLWPPAAPADKR